MGRLTMHGQMCQFDGHAVAFCLAIDQPCGPPELLNCPDCRDFVEQIVMAIDKKHPGMVKRKPPTIPGFRPDRVT